MRAFVKLRELLPSNRELAHLAVTYSPAVINQSKRAAQNQYHVVPDTTTQRLKSQGWLRKYVGSATDGARRFLPGCQCDKDPRELLDININASIASAIVRRVTSSGGGERYGRPRE